MLQQHELSNPYVNYRNTEGVIDLSLLEFYYPGDGILLVNR